MTRKVMNIKVNPKDDKKSDEHKGTYQKSPKGNSNYKFLYQSPLHFKITSGFMSLACRC